MSGEPITTYTSRWPDGALISGDWLSVVRPKPTAQDAWVTNDFGPEPRIRCAIQGRGNSLEITVDDCAMWIDCETAEDLEPIVRELQARIAMLSPGIGRER